MDMRCRHNQETLTWGILRGLEVTLASGTAIIVSKGFAIDRGGREIVLLSDTNLELGGIAAQSIYVTIAYSEQQTDLATDGDVIDNTRTTEEPALSLLTSKPDDPCMTLILAKVPRTATGLGTVDVSDRQQAGAKLGTGARAESLGIGVDASKAKLEVHGMVDQTVAIFGEFGISLKANWPGVGFNCYYNGGWKAISDGWPGFIEIRQTGEPLGSMNFWLGDQMVNADQPLLPHYRSRLSILPKLDSMVWGNTVAVFGEAGISLMEAWPGIGFNCYYDNRSSDPGSGAVSWKTISGNAWPGFIEVDQRNGHMDFWLSNCKQPVSNANDPVPIPEHPQLSIYPDDTTHARKLGIGAATAPGVYAPGVTVEYDDGGTGTLRFTGYRYGQVVSWGHHGPQPGPDNNYWVPAMELYHAVDDTGNKRIGKLAVMDLQPGSSNTDQPAYYNTANGEFSWRTSSARYKEEIQLLTEDFVQILRAEPRSFRYKASGEHGIGYIAEEIDAAGLKNLVIYDKDGAPDGVRYEMVPLYLVEVVKAQERRIASLEERLARLEVELARTRS